ncbi:choice-of-anchor C family protein [Sphaerisporangium sp. NPDC088356]|uniref:choice-of-anchor C family protein n=1 Tax=Sphaerisporangium sp. NPDC088356 TaxID=3154871 RepID=UPI0034404CE8
MTVPSTRVAGRAAGQDPRRARRGNRWRRLRAGAGLAGALAGLATVTAAPADATAESNGSFETPVVRPNTFQTFSLGQSFGAWSVTGGTVDLVGQGFWQAADGVQSLDLNGSGTGAVSQTFSTLPLVKYEIGYRLAGNPAGAPVVKTGKIQINDDVVGKFSFDTTGKSFPDLGYTHQKVAFVATGLSTTVRFASTVPGGFGPVIDDVEIRSCLVIICHL